MAVQVTVLNGFLGSGKTTLMRNLLESARKFADAPRIAVVVNEMSSLDVDGPLIAETAGPGAERGAFASLSAGSVHEQELLPRLRSEVDRMIADTTPQHLIIETSGSTRPWPLIRFIRDHSELELHGFLTLVDATMLRDDLDCGELIVPAVRQHLDRGTRGFESLIVEQCLFASLILLTKIDKLSEAELQRVAVAIHGINPGVNIDAVHYGRLPFGRVADLPPYDYHRVEMLGAELDDMDSARGTEDGIASLVIDDPRPLHPARLHHLFTTSLPRECYRSKGFFWLPSRDDQVLVWSQAAGQIGLEATGYWKAGVLGHARPNREQRRAAKRTGDRITAAGGRLTEYERAVLAQRVSELDPRFGDRRTQLTLIGERAQTERFRDQLMACFCTEDEIARWQQGKRFDDPWPTSTMELRATE